MFRQRQLRSLRGDPRLAELFTELRTLAARVANLASVAPDPKERAKHLRELAELTQRKEACEAELGRRCAAVAAKGPAESPFERLHAALPDDVALVDFLVHDRLSKDPKSSLTGGDPHLAAFVVRKGRAVEQLDLGPFAAVASAIEAWRTGTLQPRLAVNGRDPGQALRRLVWEPLEAHLLGAGTVLVAPDAELAMLPFGALPGKRPNTYLLEETRLAVVPLPRLLSEALAATPASSEGASLLLVGDVDYSSVPGTSMTAVAPLRAARKADGRFYFAPLAGTREEVESLRAGFRRRFPADRVTLLRGADATESAVCREAARHRWLHIATHGFFAPPEVAAAPVERGEGLAGLFGNAGVSGFHPGLLSGLAFAGAGRTPQPGDDDGILTALEVAELDLRGVDLAVLSACETGLGKVAGGEGMLGLQRALQVSGARTVVASLWSVPDEATRVLMERFYANLWEKRMTKLDALVEAQRWMLREGRGHSGVQRGIVRLDAARRPPPEGPLPPFYWAAFVMSGDWR